MRSFSSEHVLGLKLTLASRSYEEGASLLPGPWEWWISLDEYGMHLIHLKAFDGKKLKAITLTTRTKRRIWKNALQQNQEMVCGLERRGSSCLRLLAALFLETVECLLGWCKSGFPTVFFTSALPSRVALSLLACRQLVDEYSAELHVIITLHMWR